MPLEDFYENQNSKRNLKIYEPLFFTKKYYFK